MHKFKIIIPNFEFLVMFTAQFSQQYREKPKPHSPLIKKALEFFKSVAERKVDQRRRQQLRLTQTNPQAAQTDYQLFSGKGRFQKHQRIEELEYVVTALNQQLAALQKDMEGIKNKQNDLEDGLAHSDKELSTTVGEHRTSAGVLFELIQTLEKSTQESSTNKQHLGELIYQLASILPILEHTHSGIICGDIDIGAGTSQQADKTEQISIAPCMLQAFSAEELANLSKQSQSLIRSDSSTTELQNFNLDQRLLGLGIKSDHLSEGNIYETEESLDFSACIPSGLIELKKLLKKMRSESDIF